MGDLNVLFFLRILLCIIILLFPNRFNSESPVWMDIRRIRVPTKVYFSSGDRYCTAEENWKLVKSLPPNTTEHLFIDDLNYSHYNFAMNDKDPSLFYDVLNFLKKIEAKQG